MIYNLFPKFHMRHQRGFHDDAKGLLKLERSCVPFACDGRLQNYWVLSSISTCIYVILFLSMVFSWEL